MEEFITNFKTFLDNSKSDYLYEIISNTQTSKYIYHYTTIDGFRSIIADNGFRMSNSLMLNDSKEGMEIFELSEIVLNSLKSHSQYLDNINTLLLNIPKKISNLRYICCFSKAPDSLDMWRTYSYDNVGVCMKIKYDKQIYPYSINENFVLSGVIYDSEKIRTFLTNYYIAFFDYLHKNHIFLKTLNQSDKTIYLKNIYNIVHETSCLVKNSKFKTEKELRLMIRNDKIIKNQLKFKSCNHGLVSYINTKDYIKNDCKIPLKSIKIGPCQDNYFKTIKESFLEYLIYTGYDLKEDDILPSDVPLRI